MSEPVEDAELLRRVRLLIAEHSRPGESAPGCVAHGEGLACCVESLTLDWSDDPWERSRSRDVP